MSVKFSPLLGQLIDSLRILPGVGGKSAQRMAFSLLERNREGALQLSRILHDAMEHIQHCEACRTFTESKLCDICSHPVRGVANTICIVEAPQDVLAVEQTAQYQGRYFVLMGHLSPLDGIGPEEIGLDILAKHLDSGEITEVILATNPTIEGEATAHYIAEMCKKRNVAASRIAHGVPVGGELEFIDGNTLGHALSGRRAV